MEKGARRSIEVLRPSHCPTMPPNTLAGIIARVGMLAAQERQGYFINGRMLCKNHQWGNFSMEPKSEVSSSKYPVGEYLDRPF